MKIYPRNEFILLEAYELPKQEGKILLPNAPKDTQLYKVVSGGSNYEDDTLVYLKSQPRVITQGDKKFYLTEFEDIMAHVVL